MKLIGIEIRFFRNIGGEPVVLMPLRKCNILVGKNNVGKSNTIHAIRKISDRFHENGSKVSLSELDLHNRSPEDPFLVRLWFEPELGNEKDRELSDLSQISKFWFDISWNQGEAPAIVDHTFATITDYPTASRLLSALVHRTWGQRVNSDAIRQEFLGHGGAIFQRFAGQIPQVHIIPQFRVIRPGDHYTSEGQGLVELLARYHMPRIGREEDRDKHEQIQAFLRKLLHRPTATLEYSRPDSTLIINDDGLRLPLQSYGTGVHELLILVTAVLHMDGAICCIEEPEIHLHPHLQREFIEFLVNETSNKYILSSHSPTLINLACNDVQVFHLLSIDGATVGNPILQSEESLKAVRDLGLRASDLLQSNSIIWVEGPADRVYLRRWLTLISSDVMEGRDYVFMCYAQLPKLDFERETTAKEMVNVLQLNQNAVVLIDSDKASENDAIDKDKQRVKQRCEASGGICWITDGREIENYIPPRVVQSACMELRDCDVPITVGPFDEFDKVLNHSLQEAGAKPIDYTHNKPSYARKFAEHFQLGDIDGDLKRHVEEVAAKIREWSL